MNESPPAGLPDHLALLPGGAPHHPWALWRSLVLRGAGFPVGLLAGLALPESSTADQLLELEAAIEAKRLAALQAVNQELDDLRSRDEWSDKAQRKPLLKAQQGLSKGKVPQALGIPSCDRPTQAYEAALEQLAQGRQEFAEAYDKGLLHCSQELHRVAGWEPFREAVAWQNRRAVETALSKLSGQEPNAKRTSQRRQHEELVASYLQRYCAKNDTIGFFGPVCWARLADEGKPVELRTGPQALARREVYFEVWCIDALAEALSEDPALKPWMPPRLKPSFSLEGLTLHRAIGPASRVTPAEAQLLVLCNGKKTARAICSELLTDPSLRLASESEAYEVLESLHQRKFVTWRFEVPLELYPEETLRRQLEQIADEEPRQAALAKLEELIEARRAVAAAAGDAAALDHALRRLEETFSHSTGAAAHRRSGQMYASRALVYEDCQRDAEVEFGPELLDRLGAPLDLILRSARWVTTELYRVINSRLEEIFDELCAQRETDELPSHLFFVRVFDQIFDMSKTRDDCFEQVERSYQERWSRVLALDTIDGSRLLQVESHDLAKRFDENFPAGGNYWSLARYFSPDLMIAAASKAAFEKGDFQLVLGEAHTTNTLSWSCFVSQHPHAEELMAMLDTDSRDLDRVVLPHLPKNSFGQRINVSLVLPRFFRFQLADDPPPKPPCHTLPGSKMTVVRRRQGLRVVSRDKRLDFDVLELFGFYLCESCNDILGEFLPPATHQPRLEIDGLVVSREKWRFKAQDLEFSAIKDSQQRFLEIRRWARSHGIPRYSFFKLASEVKPCFLDLDSPIFVDLFAKLVRGVKSPEESVSVSEMLPRVDQAWLEDREGQVYTSELRLAALEPG